MVHQDRDVMPFMPIVAHGSDNNTPEKAEASFEESDPRDCITMESRSLPEVVRWIACRILTPDQGDSHDDMDTQCAIHVNRLLFFRRYRSHRAAHWLCQTHVEDDGQTFSGPCDVWGLE